MKSGVKDQRPLEQGLRTSSSIDPRGPPGFVDGAPEEKQGAQHGGHPTQKSFTGRMYHYGISTTTMGFIIIFLSTVLALYGSSLWPVIPSYFAFGRNDASSMVALESTQDLWCGKPYKYGSPTVPVGGQFPIPTKSPVPLLNFRCWPGVQPFVEGEDSVGSVILDAFISRDIGTPIISFRDNDRLSVTIRVSDSDVDEALRNLEIASGTSLLVNSGSTVPTFGLGQLLKPRPEPYNLLCTAYNSRTKQKFTSSASLQYLPPNPYGGSVVKTDLRTGGLLVKPLGQDVNMAQYEPFFPYGFYTSFGGYVDQDLSKLDHIKAKGYNLVHLVPPFNGIEPALDRMEELGLWFIYSMRWTFQNLTSVSEEVTAMRTRRNLLLWYTSDEPDGWNYALDAPKLAADKIKRLDGGVDRGYHPVSVVLNCEDYWFKEWYTDGSDIVMHDTYPVDINATYSIVYNTTCTPEYGDCGCDNCIGDIGEDISTRITQYRDRARWLGKGRTLSVWSVPQAFGNESFWPRKPTGKEFVVQSMIAVMHGSLGINPWLYPTTDDIDNAASRLGLSMPRLASFIHAPGVRHDIRKPTSTTYVGCFASRDGSLILAINTGSEKVSVTIPNWAWCQYQLKERDVVFESGEDNSIRVGPNERIEIRLDGFGVLAVS